ncbi:MAG: lysophospholipase [Spirochaetia bacterium]
MADIQEAVLPCSDAFNIFYRFCVPGHARAGVIILHGYGEHSGRYRHVIEFLANKGFACFAPDHRGHGQSARVMGYVPSFDRILADVHELYLFIREKYKLTRIFLFGHSMGALISLNYLVSQQGGIMGAVLNAPMIIIPDYISPVLKFLSGTIASLLPTLPLQKFDATTATHDPEIAEADKKDPLNYHGKIRARTGVQMIKAMEYANAHLTEITLPLLIIQGGDDLTLPVESAGRLYRLVSSKDKTLKYFAHLYHETWNEPQKETVLNYIDDWIKSKLK